MARFTLLLLVFSFSPYAVFSQPGFVVPPAPQALFRFSNQQEAALQAVRDRFARQAQLVPAALQPIIIARQDAIIARKEAEFDLKNERAAAAIARRLDSLQAYSGISCNSASCVRSTAMGMSSRQAQTSIARSCDMLLFSNIAVYSILQGRGTCP